MKHEGLMLAQRFFSHSWQCAVVILRTGKIPKCLLSCLRQHSADFAELGFNLPFATSSQSFASSMNVVPRPRSKFPTRPILMRNTESFFSASCRSVVLSDLRTCFPCRLSNLGRRSHQLAVKLDSEPGKAKNVVGGDASLAQR